MKPRCFRETFFARGLVEQQQSIERARAQPQQELAGESEQQRGIPLRQDSGTRLSARSSRAVPFDIRLRGSDAPQSTWKLRAGSAGRTVLARKGQPLATPSHLYALIPVRTWPAVKDFGKTSTA